ncbi:feruloyl-CoA synthase [Pararhizobium mangrovi]|uniref:Feruloyl-CoA synthase n=1 Tax=Pararhizobium mangrovi TaxID=2590452 RepID=A0A506U8J6_9HYPH|nr:feruloyl-CoA synthase [Pararhizobium mangrovi]TPW30220.1 feruloyl-CoA synthase [Pararhizobium mangrovi]
MSDPGVATAGHEIEATRFAQPSAVLENLPDGSMLLRHGLAPAPYDRQVGDWLRRWSDAAPDRVFLAAWREDGSIESLTYAETRNLCDRLSQALIGRDLGAERPIAILSEKSLSHALLTLAALQVGIPVAPLSPTYSLRAEARGRLKVCLEAATPGLVLVEDGDAFEEALALVDPETEIVHVQHPPGKRDSTDFASLLSATAGEDVDGAFDRVDPDAPAKILFTSGSTGVPKPVINTHRMMCANATAQAQLYPFLTARPPVVVDWQPWHHCGGSSFNFHAALANGGSYYIDTGKPTTAQAFAPTLRALSTVSPTIHFNVPLGYEMLAFHLERDDRLRQTFFAELDCLIYAAASMPPRLWQHLERLSERERGRRVPMMSSYGTTELAPMHTSLHWHENRPGLIGLPIPGSQVKLVPCHDKLELRARGPNVTPGYFRAPAATQAAFDAEGWYMTGDAVRLCDPDDPARGLVFEGRLSEEFKLSTGTFVQVGAVRTALVSACPLVGDALIVGENRNTLGALLILDLKEGRSRFGDPDLTMEALVAMEEAHAAIKADLARYNAENTVSSRRIAAAMPILDIPSLRKGETTDKGYINQRLAVARRADLVEALYDADNSAVIRP